MDALTRVDYALSARGVLSVLLNRPEEKNAIDGTMVSELIHLLDDSGRNPDVRALVIRGAGDVFSEGTDLRWLDQMSQVPHAENLRDATNLATLLEMLDGFPKPVVAVVHGAVTGEALGLVCACDVVVASADTLFRMVDLSFGLVPACVAPFLIAKAGQSQARNLLLTGRPFDAQRAKELRIVHEIVATRPQMDSAVEGVLSGILSGSPMAHKLTKSLIRRLTFHGHSILSANTLDDVARCLAQSRESPDVREGLQAVRSGRKPSWAPSDVSE